MEDEQKTLKNIDHENDFSNTPIVLNLKKKKKRKKRYSRGLEEVQQMELHMTRAMHRAAQATGQGIRSYQKMSTKSARKKKDGAIKDFIPNVGTAMGHTLEKASPLPGDLAKIINTKQNRKRLKRQLRALSRSLRAWRW